MVPDITITTIVVIIIIIVTIIIKESALNSYKKGV